MENSLRDIQQISGPVCKQVSNCDRHLDACRSARFPGVACSADRQKMSHAFAVKWSEMAKGQAKADRPAVAPLSYAVDVSPASKSVGMQDTEKILPEWNRRRKGRPLSPNLSILAAMGCCSLGNA